MGGEGGEEGYFFIGGVLTDLSTKSAKKLNKKRKKKKEKFIVQHMTWLTKAN